MKNFLKLFYLKRRLFSDTIKLSMQWKNKEIITLWHDTKIIYVKKFVDD